MPPILLGIRLRSKTIWGQTTSDSPANRLTFVLHLEQDFEEGFDGVLLEGDWIEGDDIEVRRIHPLHLSTRELLKRNLSAGTELLVTVMIYPDRNPEATIYMPRMKWEWKHYLPVLSSKASNSRSPLPDTLPAQTADVLPPALRDLVNFYSQS